MKRRTGNRDQIFALNPYLRPADREIIAMIRAVIREIGINRGLWLMGIRSRHWNQLQKDGRLPKPEYFRRSVWWAYCQICQPGRIRSRYDALTWARFSHMPAKPPAPTADDWSI